LAIVIVVFGVAAIGRVSYLRARTVADEEVGLVRGGGIVRGPTLAPTRLRRLEWSEPHWVWTFQYGRASFPEHLTAQVYVAPLGHVVGSHNVRALRPGEQDDRRDLQSNER
jgi:hypothetical protein